MRNIAEILEDDKNGKQLSHTERQIAVAYMQGKYDAVRELKIGNSSNTNEVLDKIYDEVSHLVFRPYEGRDTLDRKDVLQIIDNYKAEGEEVI